MGARRTSPFAPGAQGAGSARSRTRRCQRIDDLDEDLGSEIRPRAFTLNPTGSEPNSDYCNQAEVNLDFHTLVFWSNARVFVNPSSGCNDTLNSLPASWLGVRVQALKNGAVCDTSPWSYTGVAADHLYQGWFLCSNPSGPQNWKSAAWIAGYDGASSYVGEQAATSPVFAY